MESRNQHRFLKSILAVGIVASLASLGFRQVYRKPIIGTWVGYSYLESGDGRLEPDKSFGRYTIVLHEDGTYAEDGNSTSGTWKMSDNQITLSPICFLDKTPEEHRAEQLAKKGKVSSIIERLIRDRMKRMTVEYRRSDDRLVFLERSMHYEYERM